MMGNFNTFFTALIIIVIVATCLLTEVITLRQAEVLVNESTSISCFTKKDKRIQWHHTPHGKKSNKYVFAGGKFYPPYNTGRFGVDNDSNPNKYTLFITNIIHEDAGLYECRDDVLSGVFDSTHLTILESRPLCTSNVNPNGFAGPNTCNIEQENMIFSCAVSFNGNCPNLMWSTLDGSQVLKSSFCEKKDNRINCNLSIKADRWLDGSTLICRTAASNDARYNCSFKDIRVIHVFGDYETAEERVDDDVTCMFARTVQIHYNWTIQQNNQENIFSTNQTIYFQKLGFSKCCFSPIVAVNVSNIVDDKEMIAKSSNISREWISIGVSFGVSIVVLIVATMCVYAVIAFVRCRTRFKLNGYWAVHYMGFVTMLRQRMFQQTVPVNDEPIMRTTEELAVLVHGTNAYSSNTNEEREDTSAFASVEDEPLEATIEESAASAKGTDDSLSNEHEVREGSSTSASAEDCELKPALSLVPKENGVGVGVGVAFAYFFSFLQIVVPGVWNSLVKEIQRPSAVKELTEKTFILNKMLIIIPKTLRCPIKLTDYTNFRRTDLSIKQCFHRAGKERREYTIPIYELTDKESENVYYFVTDIPSCLYAIREAYDSGMNIMSRDDVFEARNNFVQTVKDLLTHPHYHSEFENQCELLLWPDNDDDNNRMALSEFVSQQIKSKELAVKLADILKQPITGKPIPESSDGRMPRSNQTFAFAGGISAYPMYSERPRYVLKNYPRGYCLIINNFEFPKFEHRSGAAAEIEALKKLFEGLKFKVDARKNLTAKQMVNCLIEYRDKDHSGSDAFVCCLLSHGEKGRIAATDGQLFPVIKLMELFYDRNCPGLAGKPKLFFIGASQGKGEDEKCERIQSTSTEPNPPDISPGTDSDGWLLSEAKKDPADLVPFTSILDLHDSERGGGPYGQCDDRADIVRDFVPSCVDFIVSYACLPETEAWHHATEGGLYVQALCKHLNQDLEIDFALRNVNQEVRDLLNTYDKEDKKLSRQEPFHIIMPPHKCLFLGSD